MTHALKRGEKPRCHQSSQKCLTLQTQASWASTSTVLLKGAGSRCSQGRGCLPVSCALVSRPDSPTGKVREGRGAVCGRSAAGSLPGMCVPSGLCLVSGACACSWECAPKCTLELKHYPRREEGVQWCERLAFSSVRASVFQSLLQEVVWVPSWIARLPRLWL